MLPSPFPFPAAIRRGLHRRTRAPRRRFGGIAIVFAVFSLALSGEGVYNMLVLLSAFPTRPFGARQALRFRATRALCPPAGRTAPAPGKERMFS